MLEEAAHSSRVTRGTVRCRHDPDEPCPVNFDEPMLVLFIGLVHLVTDDEDAPPTMLRVTAGVGRKL